LRARAIGAAATALGGGVYAVHMPPGPEPGTKPHKSVMKKPWLAMKDATSPTLGANMVEKTGQTTLPKGA
jgi:hypothetical protein